MIRSLGPTKALIVFSEDDGFRIGDTIFAYFPDGSRKATLVIKIIKNKQAIAEIREGEPEEGDAVRLPPIDYGAGARAKARVTPPFWSSYGFLNIVGGASSFSQKVKLTDATDVTLEGFSPLLRLSISNIWTNHPGWIWDLGASVEMIDTKGSTVHPVCGKERNCVMTLIGVSPSARLGYQLAPKFFDLQVRGVADLFIPAVVTTNVVDYAPLIPLPFVGLGLFVQKRLSETRSIPLSLDYSFYVGDQNVRISRWIVSTGFSWR